MIGMISQANPLLAFLAGPSCSSLDSLRSLPSCFLVLDVTRCKHAVRRDCPVIGRFRYWLEHLGEFCCQYFLGLDREEIPFGRAERAWACRAAKGANTTLASVPEFITNSKLLHVTTGFRSHASWTERSAEVS